MKKNKLRQISSIYLDIPFSRNRKETHADLKYRTHPLIRMLLNSNFRFFKHIFKSLEFALGISYTLCCLIQTLIMQTFH